MAERTDRQKAGDAAESLVSERLAARGWQILARNVHFGRSELDIVAIDPGRRQGSSWSRFAGGAGRSSGWRRKPSTIESEPI